jgi:hypothetical protein
MLRRNGCGGALSAISAGMGVVASSGADREALRHVANVSVKIFEEQSAK